jgi:uncharacterized protein (TIGR03067 family)
VQHQGDRTAIELFLASTSNAGYGLGALICLYGDADPLDSSLSLWRIPVNHSVLLPAVLLFALPCLALCDDPNGDESAIDGTWLATAAELGGQKLPPKATASIKLTLKNGTYEVVAESPDRGTVKYETSAKPKAMVIKGTEGPNKGKTFPAIYELSGDKLTICYDLSGAARPTEFKSRPKTKLFLVTYQRQKP